MIIQNNNRSMRDPVSKLLIKVRAQVEKMKAMNFWGITESKEMVNQARMETCPKLTTKICRQ